jgi:TetR/AcrR family tetracycline transcriptional repressor
VTQGSTSGSRRSQRNAGQVVRPALSRESIIKTALDIVDQRGIAQLSMRKLGGELGVDPMAVYYYLPNKQALFDGLVEAVYAEIDFDIPEDGTVSWRYPLETFGRNLRKTLSQHPEMLQLVATRPVLSPNILRYSEWAIAILEAAGFTGAQAVNFVSCLRSFTVGHAFAELSEPVGAPAASEEEITAVLTERFPKLAEAITGGYRPDQQYELGLQAMLDGFEDLRPRA